MTTENKTPPVTDRAAGKAAEKVVDAAADAIKEAVKATPEPVAPAKPTSPVRAYTSTKDVYVDQRYYKAGEVFVTNAKPADHWDKVTPKEVAAIEGSTDLIPDDAQFDEASTEALQAYALIKRVPIVGIAKDRKALITAIKAANEPKL